MSIRDDVLGSDRSVEVALAGSGQRWRLDPRRAQTVGRDSTADIRVDHPEVSRRHAEVRYEQQGWVLRDVGSANGIWVRGHRVATVPLIPGEAIALGSAPDAPRLLITGDAPGSTPLPAAPAPRERTVVVGRRTAGELSAATVTIGRAPDNDLVVDDLLASRRHARATRHGDGFWVEDLGSLNGSYINGAPVTSALLRPGDVLTVGHLEFAVDDGQLVMVPQRKEVSFVARDLGVVLPGGKRLLENVGFALPASSLLAVIGPSGAGKSTLLGALTGARRATGGQVLVDGRDLYENYGELRRRIGVVPQDDVVHPQLTVRQALDYASELRFPADLDPAARRDRVTEVIHELGLDAHAATRIDRLSGGQRKRTSVALELLTQPSLLFLDEPTSGLDPGLDKSVMNTLRTLADGGRTVVVTHSVANLSMCDRVLLLAPGGRVAYFGPPNELLGYFGRDDYSDVFADVAAAPEQVVARFAQHHARTAAHQVLPTRTPGPAAPPVRQQSVARQAFTLLRRHARVLTSDRSYAVFQALLPPVLAALVTTVPGEAGFGWPRPPDLTEPSQLLVILIVGAAFMGVASSARDLVGERAIYRREKAVGLAPTAYLLSKLIAFGLLAAAQSAVLVGIVLAIKDGPGSGSVVGAGWLELWFAVAATAFCSAVMGLLISAVVSSSEQVMPLLVVSTMAQLVLCGGLIPVAGRTVLEQLAWLAPSRWGFAAAASTVDANATPSTTAAAVSRALLEGGHPDVIDIGDVHDRDRHRLRRHRPRRGAGRARRCVQPRDLQVVPDHVHATERRQCPVRRGQQRPGPPLQLTRRSRRPSPLTAPHVRMRRPWHARSSLWRGLYRGRRGARRCRATPGWRSATPGWPSKVADPAHGRPSIPCPGCSAVTSTWDTCLRAVTSRK